MALALPDRTDDAPPPYGTVAFDCDSTLSAIEGIDELAGARKPEIAELTARAMAGALRLEDVYRHRLELLRPTRDQILAVGARYVAAAVPQARELCAALRALGKRVCIVSGGILEAVLVLGDALGVARADVLAVAVGHDADGAYAGFDEASPLATSEGKLAVLGALSQGDPRGVAFVGDGVTDLFAAPAVRRFVAFGGVVRRPEVFARATVACEGPDFAALVPLLLTRDEMECLAADPAHARLLRAARALA